MKNATAAVSLVVLLLASLTLSACNPASADPAGTQMTRKEMQVLHADNLALQKQVSQLQKQLRDAKRDLVRAKEDQANYKYVKAENEKFLNKLAEEGPKNKGK